ncbi:ABC transporter ATP-binding protein [Cyanobacterium sp. Dongsha4]|uniref:ABC transporter ATP-binding protein n=1 Tax=Cyanobacterium sp. DS4 TaxID=2878255 RepID=UPI002E80179F|nr:ABC transporter ATP-binding protein [Cyanobacterium sp. Dongsha4]WVK99386.1 ABC transporter ATP-binding protein [Cyanobacterium sp. Dongsha4]
MITVEKLSKNYGSTQAIKDISFSVEKGSILGLLGANGAGKTTTMRILSGYIPATTGKAIIDGFEVHENPLAVRERIGYLPENPPLYPEMTVTEYLDFVGKIKNIPRCDRTSLLKKAIELCQIEDRANSIIGKLSKGYRQRVGIAQAIIHDPPVIILDEPTVGLDPRQIIEVRNLIKSLAKEKTIILSTHILPEVTMTCDTVTIINQGMVIATGKTEELLQQLNNKGYHLEVEGEVSSLTSKLEKIDAIDKIIIEPITGIDNRFIIKLSLNNDSEVGKEIASILVHEGIGIYEMKRLKASLEEVFLQLTTQENISVNN